MRCRERNGSGGAAKRARTSSGSSPLSTGPGGPGFTVRWQRYQKCAVGTCAKATSGTERQSSKATEGGLQDDTTSIDIVQLLINVKSALRRLILIAVLLAASLVFFSAHAQQGNVDHAQFIILRAKAEKGEAQAQNKLAEPELRWQSRLGKE